MNGIDSTFDIEQLRSSINEQSIPSLIAQIHQWIDLNGTTMMKSNQKLPFNFKEAEELRKLHEKIELKCMKFLAFYAHMNLKAIPEEYESMRQNMDIAIHNFSERVKSRRHVVVSFFTFYRHLNELTNMFKEVREEDHTHIPDTLPDVEKVIEKYHNSTTMYLRKFSHLKDEANRVKASLDAVIKRDNESPSKIIDHVNIKKALKHIDDLLQQTELELASCYESQHLLEMEIKIEAKMMLIEDEIIRSSLWIRKIIDFIRTKYSENIVGKSTVENDILQDENRDLIKKLEMAHEYGCRLHQLYSKFCQQFDRETERGDTALSKFDELWNSTEPISAEYTDRLKIAGNLFHNLDTTLERVEDLLMAINKDKESIDKRDSIYDKYQPKIRDIQSEYHIIKKVAENFFLKLQHDLQNKKLLPKHPSASEIEQTVDMVKMKIFTLSVKIKSLDRCLNNGEIITMTFTSPKERSASDSTDYDNAEIFDIIKKYLGFLNSSLLNWESKPLPKTLDQAKKSIESHKKLAEQSSNYWKDIQKTLAQYYDNSKKPFDDKELKDILSDAENQKRRWDKKWHSHLKKKLDPRLQLLLKIQSFSDVLGEDMGTLDDFVTRPNHSLPLVNDLKDDLERMAMDPKSEHLQKLSDEAHAIHKSDFDNIINSLDGKVDSYFDRLHKFLELEKMIQEIHEFLPRLKVFKSEWHTNVDMHRDNPVEMAELKDEAKQIHNRIDKFDIDRLRKLATAIYGSSKRVEWLIDELVVDFSIPKQHRTISASHKVVESKIKPLNQEALNSSNLGTPDKKLLLVNAESNNPTKLDFELESLPRIECDQYDIQWYKDDKKIVPSRDSRIVVHCDSRSGKLNMEINNCQESDAGKYWCEIKNDSSVVKKSSPVLLSVFTPKQGSIVPQFSEKTYGAVDDPLSFKLNLEGFKYAPETELIFNNIPINVNHASCKWSRVSSNVMLEFKNASLTHSDKGQYLFRVSGKEVAKTQVEVGDKPEFIHHKFIENCPLGNSIKISIPMKTNIKSNTKNIVWKKNKIPLTTTSKLNHKTYINATGDLVLEIPKFTEAHVGDYSCQVSNEFGTDNFQLNISIAESAVSPQTLIPVSSTPLLSSTNDYLSGKIGDSIILDAKCSPGANNHVVWTKDNQPLKKDDSRIQIFYPNNSKCSLQINNVEEADSGTYRASLKDIGEIKKTTVEITPVPFAPVIQDFPQNVRVKQNDNINLVCVVNSFPFAQSVNWTVKPADGSPVRNLMNNARYKIINKPLNNISGHKQKLELYFDNVTGSDAGEYGVRVENDTGWSSVSIPVLVSVASEVQNKKSSPKFINSLDKEIISPINEKISLKCKLAGNPTPTVKWLKNGKELSESNRIKIYKTGDSHELVINNLQKSDTGFFEASASNTQGFEVCKCQLKVTDSDNFTDSRPSPETPISFNLVPKDNREINEISSRSSPQRTQMIFSNSVIRSPPQFVTTFTDEVVKEGDDVVLKCCLIGYPEPVVWWSYNTHFINDSRFEMKRELDEYYLYLRNIQKTDSGRYSITAENSSGLATCSALVIVDLHLNKSTSIDRSKYPSNSRPLSREAYSSALRSSLNDDSKIMQASPRGWQEYQFHSNASTPRSSKNDIFDGVQKPEQNISTTTTKTIKTYHYSGPSGVDLPGVGFIPKITHSVNNSASSSSSSSSRSQIEVAKFVSGENKTSEPSKFVPYPYDEDTSRFSVVESSECDFPL